MVEDKKPQVVIGTIGHKQGKCSLTEAIVRFQALKGSENLEINQSLYDQINDNEITINPQYKEKAVVKIKTKKRKR